MVSWNGDVIERDEEADGEEEEIYVKEQPQTFVWFGQETPLHLKLTPYLQVLEGQCVWLDGERTGGRQKCGF